MTDHNPTQAAPGRKVARGADLIIPALAAAFTVYFLTSVSGLAWEARANGTVIGVFLLLFVAVQVVRILLEVRAGRADLSLGEFGIWSPVEMKRIWILVILSALVLTIGTTGTTIGLFLCMAASMWVLGMRSVKTILLAATAVALTGYVLFIALLKTQFPEGPFEWAVAALIGAR